jgi:2-phosphosulfolactate phosphatase
MRIKRATLESTGNETDTVVVIDVLRAFTTAAYAFDLGAFEIILVSGIDEAFALRHRFPDALLIGEVDGFPVEGFDLGNSPSHLVNADLQDRRLIHRSTAGTQGVVRSANANNILATGLCCARATSQRVLSIGPGSVTLIQTGLLPGGWGDEDTACADLLEGLLTGDPPSVGAIINRVRASKAGQKFFDPVHAVFPASDLDLAVDIDRFDFAMEVAKKDGMLALHPVYP